MKQPANPETHLGALALHPIEQLLDVDPRPVKLQGSPLRSSDDSNQPSFVEVFVFRGLVDRANEVGSIIINVMTGFPLQGQLSVSLVTPSISAIGPCHPQGENEIWMGSMIGDRLFRAGLVDKSTDVPVAIAWLFQFD